MACDPRLTRYRRWYSGLLRLYPRQYRTRFGHGMEQTFTDLCREHQHPNGGAPPAYIFWLFLETAVGIIQENRKVLAMQSKTLAAQNKRLIIIMSTVAVLLMIPFISMLNAGQFNWDAFDFLVAGILLGGTGLLFELAARRAEKMQKNPTTRRGSKAYRAGAAIALFAALLLTWANLAVGIIGNENNPVNLMYFGVVAIGLFGAGIARFRPRGMATALFATATAQFLVPIIGIIINRPPFNPGMVAVLGLNFVFVLLFAGSALLFRHAAQQS
jgi:hypothetical protein